MSYGDYIHCKICGGKTIYLPDYQIKEIVCFPCHEENLRLAVEALENIIKHQEIVGGNLAELSTTARIAKEALGKIKK